MASIDTILVVESNAPEVVVWARQDGAWRRAMAEGIDAQIEITGLELDLPLAEIFEGIEFPPAPRLGRA